MKTYLVLPLLALASASACSTTSTAAAPVASSPDSASAPLQAKDPLDHGRELTAQFYSGETGAIWSLMNERMRAALGGEQNLAAFRQQVDGQLGAETKILDEKVTASPPYQVYRRTASFEKVGQPVVVQWTLDTDGTIAGFFIQPAQ